MTKLLAHCIVLIALCLVPIAFAYAHEVYVLDEQTILQAMAAESQNPFSAYADNKYEFYFWALASFVVVSTIFFISIFHFFEERSRRLLSSLKRFAHPLVRLSAGAALMIFGWYGVLYGPELPLEAIFGSAAGVFQVVLVTLGLAMFAGLYTRFAALAALLLYVYTVGAEGWYMLNYTTHLGAYVLLAILGSGELSFDRRRKKHLSEILHSFIAKFHSLAFPLLRMGFGFGIMFAAVYAKLLHSELTLQVVYQYELTRYFPFEPLFIVLGALIIEFLAGLMMFLGIAVRWTALFLAFWLTLGHISMQEGWWVHLILYGLAVAIFCHGYDRWSLEGRFLRRNGREPVL